jgi:hypothetical protein
MGLIFTDNSSSPVEVSALIGEVTVTLRGVHWWQWSRWFPKRHHFKNLVTNNGRNTMARLLAGTSTDTVNYLELGTGTTNPSASDTTLGTSDTATWKAIGASSVYASVYAMFELTYGTSEAVGTWTEMGLFAGATSTPDSGALFSRVLSSWEGQSGQTKSISWRILFSV